MSTRQWKAGYSWLVSVLAMAVALVAFNVVVPLFHQEKDATRPVLVYDTVITIGGTGFLVADDNRYRLCAHRAGIGCSVDFGVIDNDTLLHDRTLGLAPYSSVSLEAFRTAVDKHVTALADMEVRTDGNLVFTSVHTRTITFLAGTYAE